MNVFIVFDEEVFGWIVECGTAVLGACHTILACTIEFNCVNGAGVYFG
jgi:hypothetical protein